MISLKLYFSLFSVLLCTDHCLSQLFDSVDAALIEFETAALSEEKCKTNNLIECNAACDSFNYCQGEGSVPSGSQKCAATTPYCEPTPTGAKCQETLGTCTPEQPKTCTGEGYYPDLNNCSHYDVCGGPNTAPLIKYTCPVGFYYSSKDTFCKKGITCVRVTCPTTGTVVAPYSANPEFYYFCQPNKDPVLYKCKANEEFKVGNGCTYTCPSEGRFKIDDTNYYFCYRDGTILKYSILACPTGTTFNDENKICVGSPVPPPPSGED